MKIETWKEKLIAFCEGLEMNEIDDLIKTAKVEDYRNLGKLMIYKIKQMIF